MGLSFRFTEGKYKKLRNTVKSYNFRYKGICVSLVVIPGNNRFQPLSQIFKKAKYFWDSFDERNFPYYDTRTPYNPTHLQNIKSVSGKNSKLPT